MTMVCLAAFLSSCTRSQCRGGLPLEPLRLTANHFLSCPAADVSGQHFMLRWFARLC